jgi:hypothetical protein
MERAIVSSNAFENGLRTFYTKEAHFSTIKLKATLTEDEKEDLTCWENAIDSCKKENVDKKVPLKVWVDDDEKEVKTIWERETLVQLPLPPSADQSAMLNDYFKDAPNIQKEAPAQ